MAGPLQTLTGSLFTIGPVFGGRLVVGLSFRLLLSPPSHLSSLIRAFIYSNIYLDLFSLSISIYHIRSLPIYFACVLACSPFLSLPASCGLLIHFLSSLLIYFLSVSFVLFFIAHASRVLHPFCCVYLCAASFRSHTPFHVSWLA